MVSSRPTPGALLAVETAEYLLRRTDREGGRRLSGHRKFSELRHKGTPETLAAARRDIEDAITHGKRRKGRAMLFSWRRIR
jgi:hypothetical protein